MYNNIANMALIVIVSVFHTYIVIMKPYYVMLYYTYTTISIFVTLLNKYRNVIPKKFKSHFLWLIIIILQKKRIDLL